MALLFPHDGQMRAGRNLGGTFTVDFFIGAEIPGRINLLS
jgi:hypothetical protein